MQWVQNLRLPTMSLCGGLRLGTMRIVLELSMAWKQQCDGSACKTTATRFIPTTIPGSSSLVTCQPLGYFGGRAVGWGDCPPSYSFTKISDVRAPRRNLSCTCLCRQDVNLTADSSRRTPYKISDVDTASRLVILYTSCLPYSSCVPCLGRFPNSTGRSLVSSFRNFSYLRAASVVRTLRKAIEVLWSILFEESVCPHGHCHVVICRRQPPRAPSFLREPRRETLRTTEPQRKRQEDHDCCVREHGRVKRVSLCEYT